MSGSQRPAGRRSLRGRIRSWYGASPLHLLALLAAFALAGYAVHAVVASGQWLGFAVWFAVAIVGHDLLLFPLYSIADLSVRRLLPRALTRRGAPPGGPPGDAGPDHAAPAGHAGYASPADHAGPAAVSQAGGTAGPPLINYLRVPVAFSLLILLVWFPLILRLSARTYFRASGLSASPYLWRWLAVTGVLFAASAAAYALALRRAAARQRRARPLAERSR
jgi:hypothetical protein